MRKCVQFASVLFFIGTLFVGLFLAGCNEHDTGTSTNKSLGGSSAFNDRTSDFGRSMAIATQALDSKTQSLDSSDPALVNMKAALATCTVDKKEWTQEDPNTHVYLTGNCPVDYKSDENNTAGTMIQTYNVLSNSYLALTDISAWTQNGSFVVNSMTETSSSMSAHMDRTIASKKYGTVNVTGDFTFSSTVTGQNTNSLTSNMQLIVSYEDGGKTTAIVDEVSHSDATNTTTVDLRKCVLNDKDVDCQEYDAIFNPIIDSSSMKALKNFRLAGR